MFPNCLAQQKAITGMRMALDACAELVAGRGERCGCSLCRQRGSMHDTLHVLCSAPESQPGDFPMLAGRSGEIYLAAGPEVGDDPEGVDAPDEEGCQRAESWLAMMRLPAHWLGYLSEALAR